jgi:hypothetical protein
MAPKEPVVAFLILSGLFIMMNVILFRSCIFKRKKKA